MEVADSTVSLYNRNGIVARGNELTVDIHDGTINGPGTINAVQVPNGILLIDTAGGTIADNTISALHHTGSPSLSGGVLLFRARDGIVVSGNEIFDTDDAVLIAGTNLATVEDNDLHSNFKGVQIEASSSNNNIRDNTIQNNTFGIFANNTAGLGNTITNNDFEGATDNVTDVHLETAGAVLVGSNNQFGGDTFFIENLTTQDINLVGTGTTFDETNNFRIEDKMHHRVDTDLPLSTGLVTWVADSLFVTAPVVGSTDSSIQRGIDAASPGDTVNVEAGTYSELLTIGKDINLVGSVDGLGSATTNCSRRRPAT